MAMIHREKPGSAPGRRNREAMAAVMVILVLVIVELIIVGLAVGLSRDHDLTIHRMQTIEAMYAAEAGMNMSIREMMIDADEDGDLKTGGISDDGDAGNDPTVGNAQFIVVMSYDAVDKETTLTSKGRAGEARRKIEGVLKDPP